MSVIVSGWKGN